MEKQGTLFFGSKEEKQKIIKDILKQSQENGVVRFYNVDKNYGFITADDGSGETFVHY